MSLVDVFFAAAILGGWILTVAAIVAFGWVAHRALRCAIRPWSRAQQTIREARAQQQRAERIAEIEARANGWRIDDTELADWLAIGTADYHAGLDRLRNAINEHREEDR